MSGIQHIPAAQLASEKPHGTRIKYMGGCRCVPCRAANSRYETERSEARKNGDWNGLVDAAAARRHILALSKQGIGYKSVADVASISHTVAFDVRTGRKTRIRRRTEQRILAVTKDAYNSGNVIDAKPTWAKIHMLQTEGFTKAELARRLGLESPAIQFRQKRITGKTAARVERFFEAVMAGGEE